MVSRFGTIGGIGRVMSSGFIVSLVSDSTIEAYDKDETSESTEASLVVFGVGVMETCLSVQKLLISDGGTTGDGVAETCVTIGLHHLRRHVGLPRFFSLTPLHHSPCTIRSDDFLVAYTVRYDLVASFVLPCTISISKPLILRYLVLGEFRSLST